MKVVALVSGGKDSCFAMMRCVDYGHEIVALANLMPVDDSVDELDSYMYQTVGHQIVVNYAECMGLPLFRRRIRGSTRYQDLTYRVTDGDEVEDMFILLNAVKQQIPSISAVSSGAIASDYQRLRVESVCARLGLVSLAYLWKQDQSFLLEEMIQRGIRAITIKVAALGLSPAKHLGKELSDLQSHLHQMKELYGINVCGEGGEYETLTLDCPLFLNARIVLDKFQVILHSPDSIAPVGVLHPLAFHVEYKREVPSVSGSDGTNQDDSKNVDRVYEVQGDSLQDSIVNYPSMDLTSDSAKQQDMCISAFKGGIFSLGCWIQSSSRILGDLQEDLTRVLRRIESQLCKDGFDWADVLYVHLYISDMKQFNLANEIYVRFITEKKCYLGVPSCSTIELHLAQAGLGNVYIEVLAARDQNKKVLHVQSISCWAPCCIGPYSQATLHREVLYMAGQLGLNPPTMTLCSGGAASEIELALQNCEAVANSFNVSVATSAIIIVIYCSVSLAPLEKIEIQNKLNHFLRQTAFSLQKERLPMTLNPILLYVCAPSLPKGALVEVKPLLHIWENGDDAESIVPPTACVVKPEIWGFEDSDWHDNCRHVYTIPGRICAALVSITREAAKTICPEVNQNIASFPCYSLEIDMKSISKFCIYLLDKILYENDFSWGDLMQLRLYFTADLSITADTLSLIISEVISEFKELTGRIGIGEQPMINLLPVVASGSSASMENLLTCEAFASKL